MARPRGTKQQRQQQAILASGGGRLIGYIRVSTLGQAENGHSLPGQIARLQEAAVREGFELLEVVQDVKSGAKRRDGLDEVWARVRAGEAEGILTPKVDRLGRSQLHLASLVEQARDEGLSILTSDEGWQVRRGTLCNEALPFLIAMAQVERERISRRTREGLEVARRHGTKTGNPFGRPPENTDLQERATELRREGLTLQAIADLFNEEGHRTARRSVYRPKNILQMVNRVDPSANPEGGYRGNALGAVAA